MPALVYRSKGKKIVAAFQIQKNAQILGVALLQALVLG
jgi:hypothetical protein